MNDLTDITLAPPIEPNSLEMSYNQPGWIVVFMLLMLIMLFFIVRIALKYRRNKYKREAVQALNALSFAEPSSLKKAMSVLKSTAMLTYGRTELPYLSGTDFFNFLNQHYPAFDIELAQQMSVALYAQKSANADDIKRFILQSQNWIRKHDI